MKEDKPDKFDKPMPDKLDKGGRRLSGMDDKMMLKDDKMPVKEVPAPPPCYTIQVDASVSAPCIIGVVEH